ncbi:APC family permease [Gulosibacter molinativorax]|uniref:APC family permease n=2 Tax=Gulosibacter molinativorax TaxID=256821 RepID=A0ABT7C5J6_9MICO|nr:APC family permease [Gulosibacter molinativorax]MDJ1370077.1 APC family permease [Gulosibacter molinativorax]QUY63730.1 Putative cationic amino acid transporter APC family [Gulosibacter molinativorax]
MVGFGWVTLVGGWIDGAGTMGATGAMLAGGVMMAIVALVYSEMVAAMPKAGGEHNYILRALGPRWSFIGSWGITGGYATVVAFEAVALPTALEYVVPLDQIHLWSISGSDVYLSWALVGAVTAVLITIINIFGVKIAGSFQMFVVIFLFAIGFLQIFGSVTAGEVSKMEPFFNNGWTGFFAVLVIVPFMFVGFDVIPQTAEEVNLSPKKTGRIAFISVLIAAAWYIMIILTVSSALTPDQLTSSTLPAADAMSTLFGGAFFGNLMVAAGISGIVTSWNSLQMGASRLMYSLAQGGMLPAWLGKLHPKFGTPVNALLVLGAIATAAPFFGHKALGWIVDAGSPMIVIAYLLVSISFVVLRKREPDMPRPLRVGGKGGFGVVVGATSVAITAFLVVLYLPGMPAGLGVQPWIIFGVWWLVGAVFFAGIPGGVKPGPNAEEELLEKVYAKWPHRRP